MQSPDDTDQQKAGFGSTKFCGELRGIIGKDRDFHTRLIPAGSSFNDVWHEWRRDTVVAFVMQYVELYETNRGHRDHTLRFDLELALERLFEASMSRPQLPWTEIEQRWDSLAVVVHCPKLA